MILGENVVSKDVKAEMWRCDWLDGRVWARECFGGP